MIARGNLPEGVRAMYLSLIENNPNDPAIAERYLENHFSPPRTHQKKTGKREPNGYDARLEVAAYEIYEETRAAQAEWASDQSKPFPRFTMASVFDRADVPRVYGSRNPLQRDLLVKILTGGCIVE